MKIRLKEGSARWEHFGDIKPKLGVVFYDFCQELEFRGVHEVWVTSIIRPVHMIDGETGIHSLGRAIDVSLDGIDEQLLKRVLTRINTDYIYDFKRLEIKTAIVHDMGAGRHLHLQVL